MEALKLTALWLLLEILAVMAYDRFVAICYPLHYLVIIKPRLCGLLVLVSFFVSLLDSQIHCLMVSQLAFCKDVDIPHFFCIYLFMAAGAAYGSF